LNKHAPDKQRSTILSVASFFKVLPYVALAPLIGWLNANGRLDIFLIGWSVLMVVAWGYYFARKRQDNVIKTEF
jgi:hypothetical protein